MCGDVTHNSVPTSPLSTRTAPNVLVKTKNKNKNRKQKTAIYKYFPCRWVPNATPRCGTDCRTYNWDRGGLETSTPTHHPPPTIDKIRATRTSTCRENQRPQQPTFCLYFVQQQKTRISSRTPAGAHQQVTFLKPSHLPSTSTKLPRDLQSTVTLPGIRRIPSTSQDYIPLDASVPQTDICPKCIGFSPLVPTTGIPSGSSKRAVGRSSCCDQQQRRGDAYKVGAFLLAEHRLLERQRRNLSGSAETCFRPDRWTMRYQQA